MTAFGRMNVMCGMHFMTAAAFTNFGFIFECTNGDIMRVLIQRFPNLNYSKFLHGTEIYQILHFLFVLYDFV